MRPDHHQRSTFSMWIGGRLRCPAGDHKSAVLRDLIAGVSITL
jgi:hypothetical protein